MSDRIVFLRDSLAQSIAKDTAAALVFCGLIGVGVALDSEAMQWVGSALAWMAMLAWVMRGKRSMTPQEAANWLRDEYDVNAEG